MTGTTQIVTAEIVTAEIVTAETIIVAAFYRFVAIDDCTALRVVLLDALQSRCMKGTILLAREGINGTVSGSVEVMHTFLRDLRADTRFAGLVTKEAATDRHPFKRLKVKIKREIIRFDQPVADPAVRAGIYVRPEDWNTLIARNDVLVLDTRNAYEVAAGTFAGAVDPGTRHFTQFAAFAQSKLDPAAHPKVAMFCTGGIRCEKASAYLKARGFPEVYHLDGGILNYLARVPAAESQFLGECFVFDERETVDGED